MNSIQLRGITAGILIASIIVWAIISVFSIYALYILWNEDIPLGVGLVISGFATLFGLSAFLFLASATRHYITKVRISKNKLEIYIPFRKPIVWNTNNITVFGCVGYVARSSKVFFCMATEEEIIQYYEANQQLCMRIFGTHRVEKLYKTDKGVWQLAVGTYLHSNPDNVFFLNYGSPNRLSQIASVLERDGIITGPWLVDCQKSWKSFCGNKHE